MSRSGLLSGTSVALRERRPWRGGRSTVRTLSLGLRTAADGFRQAMDVQALPASAVVCAKKTE
jgi:hypothetical protein